MTRENKLALVVGFALILVVGILVSDHFSVARAQETASLAEAVAVDDPLVAMRQSNPELLFAGQAASAEHDAIDDPAAATTHRSAPVARDVAAPTGRMPDFSARAAEATSSSRPGAQAGVTEHVVRARESLTAICRAKYGSDRYVAEIARLNGLANPDHVREGQTLRLPALPAMTAMTTMTGGTDGTGRDAPAAPVRRAQYTVEDGDNLSSIAGKVLGSRNLFHKIYKANLDQLESPDDLRPGMTLRIPN